MLVVSSREFRDKQKSYLDKVDDGTEVIIQRGKSKSYKVIPVSDDDAIMSKTEWEGLIESGLQNMRDGKGTEYTLEQLKLKLGL